MHDYQLAREHIVSSSSDFHSMKKEPESLEKRRADYRLELTWIMYFNWYTFSQEEEKFLLERFPDRAFLTTWCKIIVKIIRFRYIATFQGKPTKRTALPRRKRDDLRFSDRKKNLLGRYSCVCCARTTAYI